MQTIQTCIIGAFLLLGATVEVKAEESKNVGEPVSSVVKPADSEAYFPKGTEIDDSYYRAALLPSMMHKREEKGNLRFRFAILPSFSKPLFLTYSRGSDGASIEITRLELRWVNEVLEPVGVELNGKVKVGKRIAELLEEEVTSPGIRTPLSFLTEEQRKMTQGLDGTTYAIEVSTDTDYTVECVWTPEAVITEKELLKFLEKQNVDVGLLVGDLKEPISFRDRLLDLVEMKEARYSVSELLDNG